MSEIKFTPGPWVYREKCGDIGVVDHSDTQSYGMLSVIAHMDKFDFSEHKENAHLIAAAPELYEALSSIENDDGRIPDKIWEMRNSALAKARGGE